MQSATNVFEVPMVYAQHRQLQQRMAQAVRVGKIEEMEAVCREGVALLPLDPIWRYNLACALAYRADKRAALEELERAIDLGYNDYRAMAADNDLKQLAALPKFAELAKKAERFSSRVMSCGTVVKPPTVLMGMPAEVRSSNTVWDFEAGCFRAFFQLLRPDLSKIPPRTPGRPKSGSAGG